MLDDGFVQPDVYTTGATTSRVPPCALPRAARANAYQFHEISSGRLLELWLQRETAYVDVLRHQLPYLKVDVHGTPYAFKLVKSRRNFILEPEIAFCDKVGIRPIAPAPSVDAPSGSSTDDALPAPSTSSAERGPRRFSEAELLEPNERQSGAR